MSRKVWFGVVFAITIGLVLSVSVYQFIRGARTEQQELEQLAEQAAAPLEESWFTIDSHGNAAAARSRRAQAFRQLEQAGIPAIPKLLDLRGNPDKSVSQNATTAIRNASRQLEPTSHAAALLLIEVLDKSRRPTVAVWAEQALRDIGGTQSAVPAMMLPLTDQSLRKDVVLELAGAQWRGVSRIGSGAGPIELLYDIMQQAFSSKPSTSASVKDLELLYRQVMGAQSILLDSHHIRDLPPVTELAEQLNGPNAITAISGLRRIAESNASVAGLDLGELTPDLSPAVITLSQLTNSRQQHLKAHAVAILNLINSDDHEPAH